ARRRARRPSLRSRCARASDARAHLGGVFEVSAGLAGVGGGITIRFLAVSAGGGGGALGGGGGALGGAVSVRAGGGGAAGGAAAAGSAAAGSFSPAGTAVVGALTFISSESSG